MKAKTYIAGYDYYILFVYMLLMFIGLYMQLNISSIRTSMSFFYKQFIWFGLSIISLWFAFKVVKLEKIRPFIFMFLIITILLLIAVLIFGENVNGAVRSFRIWKINIQPSLIARIVLILYFAHFLDKKQKYIDDTRPKGFLRHFNALIIMTLIVFLLILAEKHFSPLIISSFTLISLLLLAKIRFSTILLIICISLFALMIVLKLGPRYRGERMQIYTKYSLFHKAFNKEIEYKGTNDYQIRESLLSLTGGRLFGTTPKKGTGKHYFLPEAKTDYIYSIIGEEFGFLGALFVLGLYVFLFARAIINSYKKDMFLKLAGIGLGMNIFFNAMVNIGVSLAAIPSTGVTLPFISYGGTSLLINSFTVGLLLNISAKRQRF
ncbi:MAG: FtsW/RodA/SpoVE family cell cycle protein [Candidatus Cloacimonetes bacterium]|nr:FtsW/RodA/SpoVE family cell cycle protein [Candidatus Cloacimonadota bacterium]MBL7149725.1 FtsW/RodA/SpoVE family cell cycle protein [Candidatus Cloacimonadota bacterium]